MAAAPPTVVHLKQSFLTTQTRLLSQPLAPSRDWLTTNTTHDGGLPPKAVDDALFKLNQRLQQHTRRVYAPQATRHVAEQIDALYWNAALAASESRDDDDDEALKIGSDLGTPSPSNPTAYQANTARQSTQKPSPPSPPPGPPSPRRKPRSSPSKLRGMLKSSRSSRCSTRDARRRAHAW